MSGKCKCFAVALEERLFSNCFPCSHSKTNDRKFSLLTIPKNLPSSLRFEAKICVNSQIWHTFFFFKENRGNVKCLDLSWRNRGLFSDDGKREWSFQSIHCLNWSVKTGRYCQAFDESTRINLQSDQLSIYKLNQDNIFFNSNSEIKVVMNLSCGLLSF